MRHLVTSNTLRRKYFDYAYSLFASFLSHDRFEIYCIRKTNGRDNKTEVKYICLVNKSKDKRFQNSQNCLSI